MTTTDDLGETTVTSTVMILIGTDTLTIPDETVMRSFPKICTVLIVGGANLGTGIAPHQPEVPTRLTTRLKLPQTRRGGIVVGGGDGQNDE